jgi:hypothetical protein
MNVKEGDRISAVALVVEAANGNEADGEGTDGLDPAPEQPELEAPAAEETDE